ncbi:serine hydrolase domain-containing protein [Paenibacillus macquariensis]|uniref:CubicO group peptidase, beta-lactamase class C family n=1 Tax=Paenibacillus macquariensis TaxID=948756 RepID=A0ABY1JMJ5_9BACL|nr:serine hydrolase [Paenibacillus macquariensis]MEC0092333.1 serine hydrolase [Paenibacillus macquariensis]OAB37128.1 penicillin-binding protein [Paenibacillus macquariensis subsp. macquariensis]SIQ45964.1 CubicO group peptidase, beta-lactamase class C family [Paenibacillus macquariensis]
MIEFPYQSEINDEKIKSFVSFLRKEKIESCLMSLGPDIVLQYYRNNKSKDKLHKVNSCTKSITSCLIGIAIEQGLISDLNTPIVNYFPSLQNDKDIRKQRITIDHLLSMSAGFDWPELGEWDGWPHMIHSPNWVNYILERPLNVEPGERMNYNSGCSHLLLSILQKVSGMSAKDFAIKYLFSILNIKDFIWHVDPQGVNIGGFGLHMSIDDMQKFGYFYLNKGRWGKRQLLSEEWISNSTKPKYLAYEDIGYYGRHWWVSDESLDRSFYFAMGLEGQYICVDPSRNIVIALTSNTYNDTLKPLKAITILLQ